MTEGTKSKNYWVFTLFVFCFIIIPGILILFGINYLRQQELELVYSSHQEELKRFYKSTQAFADGQKFWCHYLTNEIDKKLAAKDPSKIIENVTQKLVQLRQHLNFDYIVFHPKLGLATRSVILKPRKDLIISLQAFNKVLKRRWEIKRLTKLEERAIGKIFGPQINIDHLNDGYSNNFFLTWPDSRFKKPLLWTRVIKNVLVVVLIDYKELNALGGMRSFLSNYSKSVNKAYRFAILKDRSELLLSDKEKWLRPQLQEAVARHLKSKATRINTRDLIVFPNYLRPDVTIIGYLTKSSIQIPVKGYHVLAVILFLLLAALLTRYAWKVFIAEKPDSLSLRWKLRFLFFFANGLPLLVLLFLGADYLGQKQETLLKENLTKGISFLQSFDESFEAEKAKILVNKRFAQERLIERLQHQPLTEEILKEFVNNFGDYEKRVLLVASRSKVIGTDRGLYDAKRKIYPSDYDASRESSKTQLTFTQKIGQYFVDAVNGVKVDNKIATEIEILVESVTQKPVVNFIFEMMQKRGHFTQWGFGKNVHPSILDTFTLGYTKTEDYFFVAMFRNLKFQFKFLQKNIHKANRNNMGLRILALKDDSYSVPLESWKNMGLRNFSNTLTSFPGDEIKFIDFEGKKHLVMGFSGNALNEYNLIGLFPVSRIARIIDRQKRQLSVFALLSIILTLILSQILAQSFLVPLGYLSKGAQAIEDKHFSHRLPEMSHDEFGKMGEVFNEVMVDLDELSVASAIQEQLLPQKAVPTGNYSLYGKSISMGELGGDYYDFLEPDEDHFGVLLGDVAGHGVGAALIMAMAKAGIILSEDLLDRPVELTTRLHSLIHASKTKKQKKIMTFQYLYLDKNDGSAVYTNAGACSPMIIRKEKNIVEELKLSGAALGAFKKAKFSETKISFAPGDAIVFYTDGIVEARSEQDEEIGYDGLKKLLLNCWHANAEQFYENIYEAYANHIGTVGAQDDLTMVILVYRGQPEEIKGSSKVEKEVF